MVPAPVLAIDLGGTKTAAALVAGSEIIDSRRNDTPRQADAGAWLDNIAELVSNWHGRYASAGIAVTGGVADGAWYPLNPATLPVPPGFPLVRELSARLGVPVVAANDAQAAAWGEYRFGAGQGVDLIFLTISTGIGGGIVLDGKLRTGRSGLGGHIGVTRIGNALLEELGSGSALARLAVLEGLPADPPAIFAMAAVGDARATGLIDRVVASVARAIANLQLVLDPDCFIIGGGMGLVPFYLARLEAACADLPDHLRPILRAAALGANAGLVGIADQVRIITNAHEG
ncbi:ROK family protein [Kaistia dalseonensis]|uniref:NBD/HSP70 family sugar kinase n=1 Tax=Kaistia dalseonensis TaxID=410840 RepID=A0ABU0H4Y5_9HYPH|nr:ROK family protein [Kaistia dalseonensis]MDQ0437371.1 putative NBD/HSP70 family sugar kinase [Kaistia dalseonensis]